MYNSQPRATSRQPVRVDSCGAAVNLMELEPRLQGGSQHRLDTQRNKFLVKGTK